MMMRRVLVTAAKRQLGRPSSSIVKSSNALLMSHSKTHASSAVAVRYLSDLTPRGTSAVAQTSKDGVVGMPIDFDVNSKIEGNESQVCVMFCCVMYGTHDVLRILI